MSVDVPTVLAHKLPGEGRKGVCVQRSRCTCLTHDMPTCTHKHTHTPDCVTTYTERDAALYALTVGVAEDALDAEDLPLVYELCGDGFRVMPTFAVVFPFAGMAGLTDVSNT